jgi:ABC-type multidrug transport system fused ATPase/permease subunit
VQTLDQYLDLIYGL